MQRRKRKQVTAGSDDETSEAAEVEQVVEEAEEAAGGEVMVPEAGAWLRKSGNMAKRLTQQQLPRGAAGGFRSDAAAGLEPKIKD